MSEFSAEDTEALLEIVELAAWRAARLNSMRGWTESTCYEFADWWYDSRTPGEKILPGMRRWLDQLPETKDIPK